MSKSAEEILEESKAAMRLYFDSEIDRLKLMAARELTNVISTGLKLFIFVSIVMVGSIFMLTAIGMFWGAYLDNYALAMFYIGLCVLGIFILVYVFRKYLITNPVLRYILKALFKSND